MKTLRPLVVLTLALTLATSSIYGKQPYYQEDVDYSSAYVDSSRTAHWSVYIPIAILIGAAICFGIADRDHKNHGSSSDSQDALGSIASSKRISHSSSDSYRFSSSSDSYRPRSSTYRPSSHISSSYRSKKSFYGSYGH